MHANRNYNGCKRTVVGTIVVSALTTVSHYKNSHILTILLLKYNNSTLIQLILTILMLNINNLKNIELELVAL